MTGYREVFLGLAAAFCLMVTLSSSAQEPAEPRVLLPQRSATSISGRAVRVNGQPHRAVGYLSGTATLTVYGSDDCSTNCTAADGTSLGTITVDGDSIVVSGYTYIFALVTAWTSGTIRADIQPSEDVQGFKVVAVDDDDDVDTLETLFTVPVAGYNYLKLCGTVATSAFTDFDVGESPDGSNFTTTYTASGDYTSPDANGTLREATLDPTGWTTTYGCLSFDSLQGLHSIRFQAAGTNSDGTFTVTLQ